MHDANKHKHVLLNTHRRMFWEGALQERLRSLLGSDAIP